jgi:signal transduction histidine kinase
MAGADHVSVKAHSGSGKRGRLDLTAAGRKGEKGVAVPEASGELHVGSNRRPSPALLCAIALGGLAVGTTSFLLAFASDHVLDPGLQASLYCLIEVPYILGGALAWWRRPDSRFGPLMIAAGYTAFLANLLWANSVAFQTLGQIFDLVPLVLYLHVFLSYPSGRLETRPERVLVVTGYLLATVIQLVSMALGGPPPDNLIAFASAPGFVETLAHVQLWALSAVSLAGLALLVVRRRRDGRPARRTAALLVDCFALGLVTMALLLIAGDQQWSSFETIRRITFVTIGLAPIAFLIGLLTSRLARSDVGELFVQLQDEPAPSELRGALARALRDPSLSVAFWLPEFGSWADAKGRELSMPEPDEGRSVTLIEREGKPLAALIHDPWLDDEQELLDAVSAAAGIALENARLQAELRARLDELHESRARVVEASQEERRRLERNLHDGAQQRLIALSLDLKQLEQSLEDDPAARTEIDQARREIATSLEELRMIARGLHPAVVSGHGLQIALDSLVAKAPVPVTLSTHLDGRLDESIEVAAYYVVSESLANIGKHAQASSASVSVGRENGDLVVEVADDGVGGADTERGTGLRGLADRVEAHGGRLRVWTPRGGGTRVRAEIPCG